MIFMMMLVCRRLDQGLCVPLDEEKRIVSETVSLSFLVRFWVFGSEVVILCVLI